MPTSLGEMAAQHHSSSEDEDYDFSQLAAEARAAAKSRELSGETQNGGDDNDKVERTNKGKKAKKQGKSEKKEAKKNKRKEKSEEHRSANDSDEKGASEVNASDSSDGNDDRDRECQQETAAAAAETAANKKGKPKRSAWGIWVGNLSFNTTPQQLKRYFRNSCKGMGTVTRIRMPAGPDGKANRGFAYLDFDTEEALNIVLSLSESELDGRAILVKREDDFNKKGRIPDPKQKAEESKRAASSNEPSPTLFVGNLPFDITKVDLRLIFGPFGKIRKVRLATFQDNPAKCKGFAYIDYVDIEDAKKAHAAESKHVWKGRIIRVEYAGELATKKARPWEHFPVPSHIAEKVKHKKRKRQESDTGADQGDGDEDGNGGSDAEPKKQATHVRSNRDLDTENMAETKLQGIPVKFKGKKIVFN